MGKTQDEFAAIAGITRNPYSAWEKSATAPDVKQLAAIAAAGADVQYIVTGVRSDMALTPDERELLALFRSASLSGKAAAIGALQGVAAAAPKRVEQQIGGTGHQITNKGKIVNKGRG